MNYLFVIYCHSRTESNIKLTGKSKILKQKVAFWDRADFGSHPTKNIMELICNKLLFRANRVEERTEAACALRAAGAPPTGNNSIRYLVAV